MLTNYSVRWYSANNQEYENIKRERAKSDHKQVSVLLSFNYNLQSYKTKHYALRKPRNIQLLKYISAKVIIITFTV